MRKLSFITLLLGIGLLIWLLQEIGIVQLWSHAKNIGWSYLILIPLSALWILPNTQGFACALNPDHSSISFRKLVVTRLVGESVNYLTPSGYLGGEPVKATLMASQLGMSHAMSAVMVAKTAQTLGLLVFVLMGLLLASWRLTLPPIARVAAATAVLMLSMGVLMMTIGSAKKFASKITELASNRFSKFVWLKNLHEFTLKMDHSLSLFYREHKNRFIASTLWHLVGWAMGTVEVIVIVSFLGYSISPINAFLLSSVATLFMVGGFLIPGSLGAFELGHYVASAMVGLPPDVGISICLARRFREVIWLGIGLSLFALFFKKFFHKKPVA